MFTAALSVENSEFGILSEAVDCRPEKRFPEEHCGP